MPALEPVPRDHVVTKTFYLLDNFVGRTDMGQTWIEALPPLEPNDRSRGRRAQATACRRSSSPPTISPAPGPPTNAAQPLYPLMPGGPRQREMALRGGVNLVMYALTGNYKADQVHAKDLLERLVALNAWSLAFSPLLPVAWIWRAGGGGAHRRRRSRLWRRPRAACLRALAAALLLLALAGPTLQREDRKPLKDVVARGHRPLAAATGSASAPRRPTRRARRWRSSSPRSAMSKCASSRRRATIPTITACSCSARLREALRDTPPERVGGAIIVTDGIVHDIPASPDALGFHAPLHVLVTGHEGERDRRLELVEAPRFGIVGKAQTIVARVTDSASDGQSRRSSPSGATAS